ncbi:translation initiation factor IF-2 [Nitrospirillum sp. BR 11752]|uniref:translation initiation factor IF-2 n=1 Tax=Nitrospirillum sp. BR 11752 TaxID=3104293 RepID=UPI002EB03B6F|nr:translation initiation factor IF-2 [Nitrospirillum sp. BR 11752]
MTDTSDQDRKKLSLTGRGKLELKKTVDAGSVRQSFSHGRTKTVAVEVKRKRTFEQGARPGVADGGAAARAAAEGRPAQGGGRGQPARGGAPRQLTDSEREARLRALRAMGENAAHEDVVDDLQDEIIADDLVVDDAGPVETAPAPEPVVEEPANDGPLDDETLRRRELEELRMIQEEEKRVAAEAEKRRQEEENKRKEAEAARKAEEAPRAARPAAGGAATTTTAAATDAAAPRGPLTARAVDDDEEDGRRRAGPGGAAKTAKAPAPAPAKAAKGGERRRNTGKLTISQALSDEGGGQRGRSMAALRRAREREKQRLTGRQDTQKVTRDVIIPEVITVQELANRMAERGADVIKALMRMGVMATITQNIDTDTAELIVTEFGHRAHRVSEADVEVGVKGEVDRDEDLSARPPVVTVMGHVDHGKTSLLDALRHTDVASREAGGITQHIGAYQVQLASGSRITFIDTPGHAAFTEMRARGANVTDVVVLVVAADDGVMPQTVEAIQHAKAAEVPIIIAINKCDLPGAKPDRVRQELLQHGLVVEAMGGDVLDVEVSAKTGKGLDKLEENILLQAEILELKANPNRTAEGVVVEAKLERGRGSVATMLVQRGTLKVGDIVVAGSEWGRVRALVNDRGQNVDSASPATPVEVLGLNATPLAGDEFSVVESEARAREITEFRQRKKREAQVAQSARGSLEQMFKQIQAGEVKELPLVIKGDVQGSIEAISGTLEKLAGDNSEVKVRVLHSGVGAINESDVTLANASRGIIIGFNVRANPQAREMAKRDSAEIRYYSVIYDIIDDVRALLTGMLKPTLRERFLGNAQILEVFNITKVGKVGGCRVTEGIVKRGAGVRLLRDNVVIHEGTLKTLKRFKDEVKEVREGYECGMAFENYDNIQPGDVIEAYEMEEVARAL